MTALLILCFLVPGLLIGYIIYDTIRYEQSHPNRLSAAAWGFVGGIFWPGTMALIALGIVCFLLITLADFVGRVFER